MKKTFAVIAALVVLMLSGCVDRGTVVDKGHRDAYTSFTYALVGHSFLPIPIRHPESWQLKVDDNGEVGWVSVDRKTYDDYDIGDYYAPSD